MDEVAPGILRATLPLPTRPGHVHCYLLRGPFHPDHVGAAGPAAELTGPVAAERLDGEPVRWRAS